MAGADHVLGGLIGEIGRRFERGRLRIVSDIYARQALCYPSEPSPRDLNLSPSDLLRVEEVLTCIMHGGMADVV